VAAVPIASQTRIKKKKKEEQYFQLTVSATSDSSAL
jgi:hypothetical protein